MPPSRDAGAFYDYFHNTVMEKVKEHQPKNTYIQAITYIALGYMILMIIFLLLHFSLIIIILDGAFIAIFASMYYGLRMSSKYSQDSRDLLFEIDLRFTSIMHPGNTPPLEQEDDQAWS